MKHIIFALLAVGAVAGAVLTVSPVSGQSDGGGRTDLWRQTSSRIP